MSCAQQMDVGTQCWAGGAALLWLISAQVLVGLCAPHSHPSAPQRCFPGLAPGPGELSVKGLGVPGAASPRSCLVGWREAQSWHWWASCTPQLCALCQEALWLWLRPDCCVPWPGAGAFALLPALLRAVSQCPLWRRGSCGHSWTPTLPSAALLLSSPRRLVYDRETGKPKGYGFCEYQDQETALSAMRNLNGREFSGRALRVDNAASEKNKEELKSELGFWGVMLGPALAVLQGMSLLPGWHS